MHVGGRSCLQWVLTCAGKHEEKVSLFSFSLFVPNLFSQSEQRKKKDWELANEAVAAAAADESNVDAGDWAAQGRTSTITKHLEGK